MADKMLIDATHPEETRVVVLRGNRVEEFDFESANRKQLRGNIYLAKVTRVEPSLQAAFVDYGGNRHGFLAFSEIHPDYYQIPVADRQALIAQEERDQRDADAAAAVTATAAPSDIGIATSYRASRSPPSRPRPKRQKLRRPTTDLGNRHRTNLRRRLITLLSRRRRSPNLRPRRMSTGQPKVPPSTTPLRRLTGRLKPPPKVSSRPQLPKPPSPPKPYRVRRPIMPTPPPPTRRKTATAKIMRTMRRWNRWAVPTPSKRCRSGSL